MTSISPVNGWQTSDGEFFVDEVTAQLHQNDLNFRNWCRENVCVGGEWDARMVASAILEHWNVSSKHLTAPESASGTQYGTSGTPGQIERISTKKPAPGRTRTVPETVYIVPPSIGDRFKDEDDDPPF